MTETKPIAGFAPPPVSAVVLVAAFIGVSAYFFPNMHEQDYAAPELFTNRVFPEILSLPALVAVRIFFALVCFVGFASAWFTAPVEVTTPYRPQSKVPRIPFTIGGWKKQYPFTSWSWNVLGISFALSAYIGYRVDRGETVAPWLVRLGLILWEIAAPMTLLIGAIVRYALWPAQIKQSGHGTAFLTPRALLQHNANVVMAMTECALLGGLPVEFSHVSVSVLYGCSYVLFTWAAMNRWHDQGPAFIYFFMDTTLGTEHTMALFALVLVLMVFHGLFCGVESILHAVAGNNLTGHALFAIAVCALVCRFRD